MTIGDRIKARRLELGLSVDQVAERIGKNRATVYRYESNDIEKYPLDILQPLADALQTTPAYLMGWKEDSSAVQDKLCPTRIEDAKKIEYEERLIDPRVRYVVPSGERLKTLLKHLNVDTHFFSVRFDLDEYQVYHWVNNNKLPDFYTIQATLTALNFFFRDLLSNDEQVKYLELKDSIHKSVHQNISLQRNYIKIAGRDGTFEQRYLTDDQLAALKSILKQLPDATGDL